MVCKYKYTIYFLWIAHGGDSHEFGHFEQITSKKSEL